MSFISALKFYSKLNSLPIIEEVSGDALSISGDTSVSVNQNGFGYIMAPNQHLYMDGVSLGWNSSLGNFSIGFWCLPSNPGMILNQSGIGASSLNIHLVRIEELSGSRYIDIYIKTQSDGSIKFAFDIQTTTTLVSEETDSTYIAGQWHHVILSYNGGTLRWFNDGFQDGSTPSIPSAMTFSSGDIYIGKFPDSPEFNDVDFSGLISDFFVTNTALGTTSSHGDILQKIINHSVSYAFDTDYLNNEEVQRAFLYNDPDSVRLTSVKNDISTVYAGRTDGSIYQGSPEFWQTRQLFNNKDSLKALNLFGDAEEIQNIKAGVDPFLKISKVLVKL